MENSIRKFWQNYDALYPIRTIDIELAELENLYNHSKALAIAKLTKIYEANISILSHAIKNNYKFDLIKFIIDNSSRNEIKKYRQAVWVEILKQNNIELLMCFLANPYAIDCGFEEFNNSLNIILNSLTQKFCILCQSLDHDSLINQLSEDLSKSQHIIKYLINKYPSLIDNNNNNISPLMLCVKGGFFEIAKMLLQTNIDIFKKDNNNKDATDYYFIDRTTEMNILNKILPRKKVINLINQSKLLVALKTNDYIKFKRLCTQISIFLKDEKGNTPLHLAIIAGNIEMIKFIFSVMPGLATVKNINGLTPIHLLLYHDKFDILYLLIN